MEAICNIDLQFPRNLSNAKKKNSITTREALKVSFYSPRNNNIANNKRRFSLVITSCNGSPHRVHTINGTKVNGINVAEIPIAGRNLTNESTTDVALVTNGKFVEGRFVYRQNFVIRSYEIGPDKTATMETLMNFLQVSSIIRACFIADDYFLRRVYIRRFKGDSVFLY